MYKNWLIQCTAAWVFFLCFETGINAQLSLEGQLRVRSEFRDGAGTLKPKSNNAAFFTSQRARLRLNYRSDKFIFQTSIQDVRVWGEDASTIRNGDGRLSVHEAWAELILLNSVDSSLAPKQKYVGVKVGRQELLYDDSRLLGNLDWLQQARRHDAIVLKLLSNGWQFDLGAAFNQNTDAFNYNGTYYTPANLPLYVKDSRGNLVSLPAGIVPLANTAGISSKTGNPVLLNMPGTNGLNQHYKAMEFLYAAKQFKRSRISALIFSDQFSRYRLDSVTTVSGIDTGYIYGRRYNKAGVNSRLTAGVLTTHTLGSKNQFNLTAGAYYQTGKDKEATSLSAYTTTLAFSYTNKPLTYTIGWDLLSGNDAFASSSTSHRFDPLYGTPHKFWGYMDYFYAGTGSPSGGLSNPYFKAKYTTNNKRVSIGLDYHYFALAERQKDENGKAIKKYLGSEIDLSAGYSLNKFINIEGAVCYLAATKSMEHAKNLAPGSTNLNSLWSYVQVNIKPEFLIK
jgi:hypothetical protein